MFISSFVSSRVARAVLAAMVAVSCCATPRPVAASIVVDSADDVCAPGANPCVVSGPVEVAAGSRLDFGLRTLRLKDAGSLVFADGTTEVWCGRFEASVSGAALRARGDGGGAVVSLRVRGHCASAPQRTCMMESDCAAAGAHSCVSDAAIVRIDGTVLGNAETPARISVHAAGDIELRKAALLSGTRSASDGGSLELESTGGSVLVAAVVDVSGGGEGSGGDFSATAALDIAVTARLTATGGDLDGGAVTLDAGRDIAIGDDIRVEATGGSGAGGEIAVMAGRDLAIASLTPTGTLLIGSDGHQSSDNYGGDGGPASFEADGNMRVDRSVRFSTSGAPPDGFADTLSFTAGGDIDFDATVIAKGRGAMGAGGLVEFGSDAHVRLGNPANFDLTGAAAGGDLVAESLGDLDLAASVNVSGGREGLGGRVLASAGGDVQVSGPWTTDGADSPFSVGEFFIEGCSVSVSAPLVNAASAGRNHIIGRESIVVSPEGSLLASGRDGSNTLQVRSPSEPPRLQGQVRPAAALVVDEKLEACPACGEPGGDAGAGCDDHDFCTVDDTCPGGACRVASAPLLVVETFAVKLGRDGDRDSAVWKARFPASELGIAVPDSNVRVVVTDAASQPVFDATLPAAAFVERNAAWQFRSDGLAASGGISKASFRRTRSGTVVRATFRMRDVELSEAAAAPTLSLALLFGDEPGSAPCVSSGSLACEGSRNRLRCATPRSAPVR